MISTHPYVKWQLRNKDVPGFALNLQIESDTSKTWEELVDAGIDICRQDSNGFTPLHHALFHGNEDVSEYLLSISKISQYPEIDTGQFKLSIVDYAIFRKACSSAIINLLEEKRQEERIITSPWCRAIERMWADPKGLATLMECAPFPKEEISPIVITSIKTNNLEALKHLYNVLPYEITKDASSSSLALEFACAKGNLEAVKSILEACWKNDIFRINRRHLKNLSKENREKEIKKLQKESPNHGRWLSMHLLESEGFPLHWALKSKNQELIAFLLDYGFNFFKENNKGETPLVLAAKTSLKSTQKIITKMSNKDDLDLSINALSKPMEVSNKATTTFLKRVVKANEMRRGKNPMYFFVFNNVHWRIKEFIKNEMDLEKMLLLKIDKHCKLSYLNKDIIERIAHVFLQLMKLKGEKAIRLQTIYQVN